MTTLPGVARARTTDPETSHEAARRAEAAKMELVVLRDLSVEINGLTSKELAILGDHDLWSISPRFRPLANKGLIRDTGERRLNPGSNRRAIVWKLTREGIQFLINGG